MVSNRSILSCLAIFHVGGVLIWIIATSFMLREAELAYITMDRQGLLLDECKLQ